MTPSALNSTDRRLHQDLCLRTRNENAVVDVEIAAEEFRPSADVLQRLAGTAPLHRRVDGGRVNDQLTMREDV